MDRDHLIKIIEAAIPTPGVAFCPPLARSLMVKVADLLRQAEHGKNDHEKNDHGNMGILDESVPPRQGDNDDDPHRANRHIDQPGGALMESRDLAADQ
jgi:hypothetical protein